MTITALPSPPSTSDPTTFASKADYLLSALPQFVTEANAQAVAVNSDAANTLAAKEAALAAVNATLWVSGTSYAIGDVVWSPISFKSYRSKAIGVSSTDPASSPSRWEQLNGYIGSRTKLINGAFNIDQRNAGAAQTITAGAALAYTVDRWYAYSTGANVTGQRVAGTSPNKYNYRFTGAASVTKIGFAQRIEAINCQDLANNTATLSVDLANSLLTTVTWTAWYANTEDTFGTLASPTRTQIATGTFTVNSTITRYTTNITVPSAATTGIEIEFSVGAQTSGTWTIGRVQLEAGQTATPFETRSVGQELALCQRYYYRIQTGAATALGMGYAETTSQVLISVATPVTMRIDPTALEQSGTATDYNVGYGNTGTSNLTSVPTLAFSNKFGLGFRAVCSAVLTAGNSAFIRLANANAFLAWYAEL